MRLVRVSILMAVIALVGWPSDAAADTFVTPFAGVSFSGDAPKARPGYGAGVTFVGRSIGFEIEAARTNDFFASPASRADVTTISGAFVGGADIPGTGTKPYFLSGVALFRTNVTAATILDDTSYNNFAIVVGGGVNVMATDHLGVRADLRYLRRLERASDNGVVPIASNFDYFRFTVGLNARF